MVAREHDGLQFLQAGKLAGSQESQPVEGQAHISQILVHVLVKQVCWNTGQLVRLKIEVLQLAQVVQTGLTNLPNLVIIQ